MRSATTAPTPLIGIGEASRILQVHAHTLKLWEKRGLVRPLRTASGRRFYTPEQIRLLGLRVPK